MGDEGDRVLDGRPGDPAPGGDRRHDPGLADAGAGGATDRGGRDRPAGPPVDGPALVHAPGLRLPRLRPDDLDVLPGDGPGHPGLPARPDAGLEAALSRGRGAPRGGDGLRRQRPRRVEARRHRDLACRARSRSRSRRCSSTGRSTRRCAGIVRRFLDPRRLRRPALPGAGVERRREPPLG